MPDIETARRRLEERSLHRPIARVKSDDSRIFQAPREAIRERLEKHSLTGTRRHGKLLFAEIDDNGGWLVLHFGMTGSLQGFRSETEKPPHAHLVLDFGDGDHLAYDDQRQFGAVDLTSNPDVFLRRHHLGPDALSISETEFLQTLRSVHGAIKPALMDQHRIAGIGHIYSDEILFQARLHPSTPVPRLDDQALRALYRTTRRVLKEAIRHHANPEEMPSTWLLPHRRSGRRCPVCDTRLQRLHSAGRNAWLCPSCQKTPEPAH